MKKLLNKGQQGVIPQLCSLDVQTSKAPISLDFERVLNNPSKVYEYIPISLPPVQYLDHDIHLIPGSVFSSIGPYTYPYGQNNAMWNMVEAVEGKYTVQKMVDHIEHH